MQRYNGTYAKVNLLNIKENVEKIISKYNKYKYYFGVVKADSYGHFDNKVVSAVIKGGVNYLCVSSLKEALKIREKFKNIPILCLGVISPMYLDVCVKNDITITVVSEEYLDSILNSKSRNFDSKINLNKLKIHVKLDTGMNRLGIKDKDEFVNVYNKILNSNLLLEGIFTHICSSSDKYYTKKQFEKFEEMLKLIDLSKVKIVHFANSETLVNYEKSKFVNGCRLGIIMYGVTNEKSLGLKSTFSVYSQVVQIKNIQKGECVGYDSTYIAKGDEKIGIVQIGYADGITRKNTGRYVYINGRKYVIVGNICMDMLMVKIDDSVKLYDEVTILKDVEHIQDVANYLGTIPYEIICNISKRVERVYYGENLI